MKSAFITGANKGLGYGFVEYLLSQNILVFGGTRKITESLPQHENLIWVVCDVTDDNSIDSAIVQIKEKTDSLNYLINNTGLNKDTIPEGDKNLVSSLRHLDRTALLNMFNVNTVSPIIVTKKFLPFLQNAEESFVINISSARASFARGHSGSTPNYGYASSKIALNMMTYCSEMDLPEHVKTFAVHPGSIETDMNPDGKSKPLEKAEQIIAITSSWRQELNGKFLDNDGSLYPL